jgi:hypothetical protein
VYCSATQKELINDADISKLSNDLREENNEDAETTSISPLLMKVQNCGTAAELTDYG